VLVEGNVVMNLPTCALVAQFVKKVCALNNGGESLKKGGGTPAGGWSVLWRERQWGGAM